MFAIKFSLNEASLSNTKFTRFIDTFIAAKAATEASSPELFAWNWAYSPVHAMAALNTLSTSPERPATIALAFDCASLIKHSAALTFSLVA